RAETLSGRVYVLEYFFETLVADFRQTFKNGTIDYLLTSFSPQGEHRVIGDLDDECWSAQDTHGDGSVQDHVAQCRLALFESLTRHDLVGHIHGHVVNSVDASLAVLQCLEDVVEVERLQPAVHTQDRFRFRTYVCGAGFVD